LGEVVNIRARVTFAGRTSLEVEVQVTRERRDGSSEHSNTAYVTFVAVNENGEPKEVPPLLLSNELDEHRFGEGKRRREARLERLHRLPHA
jgi:acyl-CoA hydrolase